MKTNQLMKHETPIDRWIAQNNPQKLSKNILLSEETIEHFLVIVVNRALKG